MGRLRKRMGCKLFVRKFAYCKVHDMNDLIQCPAVTAGLIADGDECRFGFQMDSNAPDGNNYRMNGFWMD